MTKFYSLIIACSLLMLYSCKSASKSYQKGDYTEAIERGVKQLQKEPNDWETKDLVQKSYSYAVNDRENQIRMLSNSKNDSRFEKIYYQYVALQRLYTTIHQYPAVAQMIDATDYSEYVATYAQKAAEIHIAKADKWMEEGTKIAYREAYRELNSALGFLPEDFDLQRRRDDVYDMAITKVIISPIQNFGGYQYASSYKLQNFQRDILRTLSSNMNNSFVKFYNEWEARSEDIEADQILELNFSRINVGQPFDNRTSKEISKQVVVKEIVHKPDSVEKVYGTVKAILTTTKRVLVSQGDLFINLRDTKGRVIWNDRFTGEHKWTTEFVTYTGDERALSEADKKLLDQSNTTPPTEEYVMEELMKQIQNDLSSRLRGYYAKYY